MNTGTQLGEMVEAWTKLQKKFWDSCLDSKSASTPDEWEQVIKKPVELTQELYSSLLTNQAEFVRDALGLTNAKITESNYIEPYFEAIKTMLDDGVKYQEYLIESCFSTAKELEKVMLPSNIMQSRPKLSGNPMESLYKATHEVFQAWESATEKTMETQKEFVSSMAPEKSLLDGAIKKPISSKQTIKH